MKFAVPTRHCALQTDIETWIRLKMDQLIYIIEKTNLFKSPKLGEW